MMLEADERTIDLERQKNHIHSLLVSGYSMIFVAEQEDRLIGYLGAYGGEFRRNRHKV
jgi:hypothetical protein